MNLKDALKMAVSILRPFGEAAEILYEDHKAADGFTDEQFNEMIAALEGEQERKPSPVCVDHLTVYHDMEYEADSGRIFCVDLDRADNEDGTRNGGDEGLRFNTATKAGAFVASWLRTTKRDATIIQQAIDGLEKYYSKSYTGRVKEVRDKLTVPDTGNDQADYENVRDQLERLLDALPPQPED